MKRFATTGVLVLLLGLFVAVSSVWAQTYAIQSQNKPLSSLQDAILVAPPGNFGPNYIMPNIFGEEQPNQFGEDLKSDPLLQPFSPLAATSLLTDFPGADNDDNAVVNGSRVAPPDTDGDVGPNHYVQMINSLTTIFDKNGVILSGPFSSNAFWVGQGDICEFNNNGDPVVIYDEDADRWLVTQFALNSTGAPPWAQCVAISTTGDPTGAYNRYSFSFDTIGFNDYPKHGIVSNAITISARIFNGPLGGGFHGVFLGAMDKAAMYAGGAATMVGQIVGDDGITASDYDNPGGVGGTVGSFFGSAFFNANNFTIWELTPNFTAGTSTLTSQNVGTTPFNSSVPNIPVPPPGVPLDDLSGFTMHRLQIRDFGSHLSMVTNHTVNVGAGRAGVRWYEFRSTDGGTTWTLHQEGTYAPNDGENRWMGSIAMNAAGDIGLGYLLASASTFGSIRVVGQTAANSGSGTMDADELICRAGTNVQTGTNRSGDYSAMNVDPNDDTFWYTQEYFNTRPAGQNFHWDTHICEFNLSGAPPVSFDIRTRRLFRSVSGIKKVVVRWNVPDVPTNKIDFYYTQDPAMPAPDGTPDKRTRNDSKVKLKILLPGDGPFNIQACSKNSTTFCSDVEQVDFTGVPIDLNEPDEDDPTDAADAREVEGAVFTAETVELSNYPNPFNPTTLISYTLPAAEDVTLRVYNVLGQEVQTLVNTYQEAGTHRAAFSGDQLSAGVYFYVLQAGAFTQTQRMTLIK